MIKKYSKLLLVVIFSVFLVSGFQVQAGIDKANKNFENSAETTGVYATSAEAADVQIARYIGVLTGWTAFLGINIMIQIVFAGYEWMTAAGNSEKVDKAKNRIKYAFIGAIIIIGLYAMAYFFIQRLSQATYYNIQTAAEAEAGAE